MALPAWWRRAKVDRPRRSARCTGSNGRNRGVCESDFGHIDLDQQRLLHKLVVAFVRIESPLCWKDDSIDILIIGGVVESWCTTKDVHSVVMTPQETIRTKTEDLCLGVTLNSVGERDFQTAPGLGVNLNGGNFFTGKSVVGAEERCVAIGIKCLSAKVRNVDIIPWCEFIMPL